MPLIIRISDKTVSPNDRAKKEFVVDVGISANKFSCKDKQLVHIDKHVMVCFEDKLRLWAIKGNPGIGHDALIREVPVVVTKVPLYYIFKLVIFSFNYSLSFLS